MIEEFVSDETGRKAVRAGRAAGETRPTSTRRHNISPASARSLLLTLLGEFVLPSGKPAWTATLLGVLAGLGVEEKAARQALARTAATGWIASEREGRRVRWRLTPPGRRLLSEGAERIYSLGTAGPAWDGRWLSVMATVPESQRKLRHQLYTRLSWAGFGNPTPGMWISPHPEREAEAKQIMEDLGLAGSAFSFTGSFASIGSERHLVEQAWDLGDLAARYEEFLDAFTGLTPDAGDPVLLAQTRLVHEWRAFPFLDPQLPEELLPPKWIGGRAAGLFQELHAAWQPGAQARWETLAEETGGS